MGSHDLPPEASEEGRVVARWQRQYFLIKTMGAQETIGFLSLCVPSAESGVFNFTLHRPEKAHTEGEFLDLSYTSIEPAEWETHIDALETHKPLEVEKVIWTTSSMSGVDVLLRQVNTGRTEDTTDADVQAGS